MTRDAKAEAATKLIEAFAEQLLALNDGKAIPRQWKNVLLKAIKPAPQRRGRKPVLAIVAEVSRQLTLNRGRLAAPDLKMKDKRGEVKKAIADSQKTSIRAVERIAVKRRQLLDASADGKPLDAVGRAILDGIAQSISDSLSAAQRTERAAKFEVKQRKYGIRTFAEWKVWAPNNFEPHDAIYFDNRRIQTKDDLLKVIKEMEATQKSGK